MSIAQKLSIEHQKYIKEFGLEPDLVFVNFKTYEAMLTEMENFACGDRKVIYGCIWIPSNDMKEDIFFTRTEHMEKASEEYRKKENEYILVNVHKLLSDTRADWDIAHTLISKSAILAYQNHLKVK